VDDVDYILIGPKGWKSGTAASLVNGLLVSSTSVSDNEFSEEETMTEDLETGAWIALILAPGRDGVYETGDEAGGLAIGSFAGLAAGKNQDQILAIIRDQTVEEAGSDDLLEELRFKVESPYVRLDPIASVAVGEPLNVSGTTNREPETTITISTFAGPIDLPIALGEVEWPTLDEGVFSGSIDTSDAVLGAYTIEADDGDGNTDTVDVEIVTAVPTVAPTVAPTAAPTVAPTAVPTVEPTAEPTAEPTPEPPGFEAVFAIAGMLAIAYLVLRKKK
jgi:PGF-CTERM protein